MDPDEFPSWTMLRRLGSCNRYSLPGELRLGSDLKQQTDRTYDLAVHFAANTHIAIKVRNVQLFKRYL